MSTALRAQNYENEMRYIKYDIDFAEASFEFSHFPLPLMSACPDTTRGVDDVRAETRRKEEMALQKVTGISLRVKERRPGKKRKRVKTQTNYARNCKTASAKF